MLLDETGLQFFFSSCDKSAVDFDYIKLSIYTNKIAARLSMFTNHSLIKHFFSCRAQSEEEFIKIFLLVLLL